MGQATCHACGRSFSEGALLYDDDGRICPDCDVERDEREAARRTLWSLMASGPLLCFAATAGIVGSCLPSAALFFLPPAPFFALFGIVQGIRALRVGIGEHLGMGPQEKAMLLVSGLVSTLWGLLAMAWSSVALVLLLLEVLSRGL